MCVPDVVKNLNVKVFNLMSRTTETRRIEWHETCKCKCRLDASVCNNKRWNDNKCKFECKELIDKGVCDKEFVWNPSTCECECVKSCDFSEYLDYANWKCRKKKDKLAERRSAKECTENIDEVKIAEITLAGRENVCVCSCTIYVVLIVMIFTISIGIGAYFAYSRWYVLHLAHVLNEIALKQ